MRELRWRQKHKPRVAALAAFWLVLAALLLSGCRIERPVVVAFPDDARVLDGEWQLIKTGLASWVGRVVAAPSSERIVLFQGQNSWLYERGVGGVWAEGDGAPYQSFADAPYDPISAALVQLERSGATVSVTTVSLDSGAVTTQLVTLPPATTFTALTVASGRLFALQGANTESPWLHWWGLATGAAEGSVALPPFPDGMKVSSNRRLLSFWDVGRGDVTVVDTTAPSAVRTFYQGTCRGGWPAEASDDGRWFATINCLGTLTALDLSEPNPTWRTLGVKPDAAVRFARGSSRVVWQDEAGTVWANDVSVGETIKLRDAAGGQVDNWDLAATLDVDDVNGQIVAATASGQVEVTRPGTAVELLPHLGDPSARMTLSAEPPTGESTFSGYAFTGDLVWSGDQAAALAVAGAVSASYFHDYRLSPQMAPPPSLRGSADIGPADAPLFTLRFGADSRLAKEFDGVLHDENADVSYRVRLSRTND